MKEFFQKKSVAVAVLIIAILGSCVYGFAKKPAAMPKVESGSIPVLYGDFSRFLIGDRDHRSVKRLNELYALQGVVGYTVSERVDAVLLDKRAIAGLKVK